MFGASQCPRSANAMADRLWLLPFCPSPRRDDGYEVQDFCGVDPRYGTLGDQELGIRGIVNLVVNHTAAERLHGHGAILIRGRGRIPGRASCRLAIRTSATAIS